MRPEAQAQRNFTDPDSRIRTASNKGWDQCGNAPTLVDESQFILAADVTQQANDVQQVAPMLDQMGANLHTAEIRKRPREFVADAGDDSDDNTPTVQFKMKAEWQLACLTHNFLKLWRAAPA